MPLTVPAKFKTLAQMLKEEAEKTTAARETAAVPALPKAHSLDASSQSAKTPKTAIPTLSRDLAAAYAISQMDEQLGDKLFQNIAAGTRDALNLNYSPYLQPTNSTPVRELNRLGVDTTKIDKEFFDRYAWLKPYARTMMNGVPMAPISDSSPEEAAAYYYTKLWNAEEQTEKAETELISLNREVNYWAKRVDRNYSDEEILGRIDWKKYPTLTRMREGKERGKPILLNRGVEFNEDTVYGMLWSARNGESTGSHILDAMQYARGKGRKYEADPNVKAKLDPANKAYNPYAMGSTVDDAAEYFGMNGFNQKWLDDNKSILTSGDQKSVQMYQQVYRAEEFTKKVEDQYGELIREVNNRLSWQKPGDAMDPDSILKGLLDDFDALRTMDEGRLSGHPAGITRPLNYRWEDIAAQVNDIVYTRNKADKVVENPANVAISVQLEKGAVIKADGNALQDSTAPTSHTTQQNSVWDGPIAGTGVPDKKKPTFLDLLRLDWDTMWSGKPVDVKKALDLIGSAYATVTPEYPGNTKITRFEPKLGEFWSALAPDETNKSIATAKQKDLNLLIASLQAKGSLTAQEQDELNTAWSEQQGVNAFLFEIGVKDAISAEMPAFDTISGAALDPTGDKSISSLKVDLNDVLKKLELYTRKDWRALSMQDQRSAWDLIFERDRINAAIREQEESAEKAKQEISDTARWNAFNSIKVPEGYHTQDPRMYKLWHTARTYEGNTFDDYLGEALLGFTIKPFQGAMVWGEVMPTNRRLMTAEEEARYQYIYDTMGEEYGTQYLNMLMDNGLRKRSAEDAVFKAEAFTEFAPIGANISSTVLSLGNGISGAVAVVAGMLGVDLSEDDMLFHGERLKRAIREKTAEGMDETTAWFYGIGMSISDMLITRGFGKASIFFQGGASAGGKQMEILENGGTVAEASALGLFAGGLSVVIEGARLDRLFGMANTPAGREGFVQFMKSAGLNFFKEGVPEGLEEGLEYAGNLLADYFVRMDQSEVAQMRAKFLEQTNGDEAAAERLLVLQIAGDAASNMGSGMIAGGFFSALATIEAEMASVSNDGKTNLNVFTQEELQAIRDAEQLGDLAGASELYYAALERAASLGGKPETLATSGTAVKLTASMVIDAAKAFTPEQIALPEVQQKVSKYNAFAEKVLGLGGETVAGIGAEFSAAMTAGDGAANAYSGTVELLSLISGMDESNLQQVLASVLESDPSLQTAQAAVRLMRLRQEVTGKNSAAYGLAQQSLTAAVSAAIKDNTADISSPALGDAVTLSAATGHSLDFAWKRWGIAGINYLGNLAASGHADVAAILPTLPTYAKASIVAAKNMSGMALSPQGLAAQLQALSEDMNNPELLRNASTRARRQAVEARLADLNDAGAFPNIAAQQKEIGIRQGMVTASKAELDKAVFQEQAARNALTAAYAQFKQNMTDTATTNGVTAASDRLQKASGARRKAEQAWKNNRQALHETRQKLDADWGQAKATAETQIKRELADMGNKRAEREVGSTGPNVGQAAGQGTVLLDQTLPENVSNEGNERNPLVQAGKSGIMGPDSVQEDAGNGAEDAGESDRQIVGIGNPGGQPVKNTEEMVTYRRVQGGDGNNSSWSRIGVNTDGTISISKKDSNLSISIDNGEHSAYFRDSVRGQENTYVVEFEVPKWFDDFLKENTVSQQGYTSNPQNMGGMAPKLVDPTKPGMAYELPPPWVEWLEEYATNARIFR